MAGYESNSRRAFPCHRAMCTTIRIYRTVLGLVFKEGQTYHVILEGIPITPLAVLSATIGSTSHTDRVREPKTPVPLPVETSLETRVLELSVHYDHRLAFPGGPGGSRNGYQGGVRTREVSCQPLPTNLRLYGAWSTPHTSRRFPHSPAREPICSMVSKGRTLGPVNSVT